jgi:hypothetical protein
VLIVVHRYQSIVKIVPVTFLSSSLRNGFDHQEILAKRIYQQFVTFARQFGRILRPDSEKRLSGVRSMVRDSAEPDLQAASSKIGCSGFDYAVGV